LGRELLEIGKFDEAKKHLIRSIELQPKEWGPRINLAIILEQEGNSKEADNLYQQAIENGEKYLKSECPDIYWLISNNLFEHGDYEKGWKFLEEGLSKYPQNEPLNQLKSLYQFPISTYK
jgi:tetratricopeptide (TPR) repeat protein